MSSGVAAPASRRLLDGLLLLAPVFLVVLLTAFVRVDPALGVTASNGPFTDEGWESINARNFVLLGRFSTDDWNFHLVNTPFSVVQAAVFSVAGVGIAQARLVSITAFALTVAALGWGLRRPLGSGAALLAALAYGTCALALYCARLAFLEPMVALGLTVGGLLAVRAHEPRSGRWGIVAGLALALAIGTKPSATFAVAGILVGLGVVGARSPDVRRWLSGAVLTVAVAGLAWAVFIGLPNLEAVATDVRIWPSGHLFAPLSTMARRVLTFPFRNDGFVVLAAPIILFGALGWVAAIRARRSVPSTSIALLAVATGWLVGGLGFLALAPYRPNRYEMPLLPALAIVGGLGWSIVLPRLRVASAAPAVTGVAVAAALVAPGLILFGSWMTVTQSRLPDIQAQVRAIVPGGATVEGEYAPTFAFQAPVVALVTRTSTRVNPGDQYQARGVRWYVGSKGTSPEWASLHPAEWSSRVSRLCAPWGGREVCLWQLP